ncbi:SDR family NAD(P)-dependent oxidoreductase [Cupriavidus consociatus]|uniref:SDR family NAD(P)-dependent oxidoreductase n=1 Tax=Cupriavidus consociatus TaxID=2821357 RepID=UPI003D745BB8
MSDFERQLAPNLYGVINVLHAALPVMRKQRSGHVINISSMARCGWWKAGLGLQREQVRTRRPVVKCRPGLPHFV